jgi:hypothetical protein
MCADIIEAGFPIASQDDLDAVEGLSIRWWLFKFVQVNECMSLACDASRES